MEGEVYVIANAENLLPLVFGADDYQMSITSHLS